VAALRGVCSNCGKVLSADMVWPPIHGHEPPTAPVKAKRRLLTGSRVVDFLIGFFGAAFLLWMFNSQMGVTVVLILLACLVLLTIFPFVAAGIAALFVLGIGLILGALAICLVKGV